MTSDGVLGFGDVILVPFPFSDQTDSKRRPAVVISGSGYNARHPDVILMPITSQLKSAARPDDGPVEHWRQAGLVKPSAIKPVIATLEQGLVIRTLGQFGIDDRAALTNLLQNILGSVS